MANSTLGQKENYLDVLAVFHYVNGGLALIATLLALGGFAIAIFGVLHEGEGWVPAGCILLAALVFVLVVVGGYAVLNLLTGRALQKRDHPLLCMLTSAVNCLNMPLGTLLGIFTLVLVSDPEVKALFTAQQTAAGE